MAAHLDREHRKGQRQRDPESPGHVDQFRVGRIVERDLFGLQRHAADRTTARADLPHLGVHRAGVDRAGGDRFRLALAEIFLRIGDKFRAAAGRAEIVGTALVVVAVFCGVRIDGHAADRIDRRSGLGRFGAAGVSAIRVVMPVILAVTMGVAVRMVRVRQCCSPTS